MELFDAATLARVVQDTGTLTTQLVASWQQAARRGEPVDVLGDMRQLAMRVVGMAMFGRDLENDLEAGLAGTGANCFTEAARTGIFAPRRTPIGGRRRLRRSLAAVDRFVCARVDERLADAGRYEDMLAGMIRGHSDQVTAADLCDQAVTLFFAGWETAVAALAGTWLLLGQHPGAEARFHRELDDVLGGRAPDAADLSALDYTTQLARDAAHTTGHDFPTAEIVTVLAVAGQRIRLRPAAAALTQPPAGTLPMRAEMRP